MSSEHAGNLFAKAEILIVEDDKEFRGVLSELLTANGYKAREAESGEKAMEELEFGLPDLIILDLHFEGIDGFEVCRRIREAFPAIFLPIIVISGDGGASDQRSKGIEAGAFDFLPKPVSTRELLAKIDSFIKMKFHYEFVDRQRSVLSSISEEQKSQIHQQDLKMSQMKRFVSPQVAELVMEPGGSDLMRHHRREVTCCFFDLRGFTAFAEASDPAVVVEVLSEYYKVVCSLALKHDGTISSVAGDGIMVFFNDPKPIENHTEAALNFMFQVRADLERCTDSWREKGYSLGVGAGVATGDSMVGTIGFENFVHYTAISTTVNLAARLCKEAKVGQILGTLRGLRHVEGRVELEPAGSLSLKGIPCPVAAMNLLGWKRAN